jgi:hypothetical protein
MKDSSQHAHYYRVWEQYREFALTSRKLKATWDQYQKIFFWMTIGGTILAAAGTKIILPIDDSTVVRILGASGAVLLGLVGFLSKEFFSPSQELLWTKTRAIAEALKSEVYLYATGTPPYNNTSAGTELRRKADEQIGNAVSLFSGLEKADSKKAPDIPLKLEKYLQERIKDQEKYYEKAAKKASDSFKQWRSIQLTLGIIVVILGAMAGLGIYIDKINALIVLISALTGITTSYAITCRYEYLCKSYGCLSSRMRDLAAEGKVTSNPAEFITKCEVELSAEHRSWLTEWQKKSETNNSQADSQQISS